MMVFTWKKVQRLLLLLLAFSVVVMVAMHPASATLNEIKASHVSFISHPREVANLIIEAASSAVK